MINLLFSLSFVLAANEPKSIYLSIGETHNIKAGPTTTLEIQKKGYVTVRDLGDQFVLTAKKLGKTRIQWDGKVRLIEIIEKRSMSGFRQLEQWVINKRGPELKIIGNKTHLTGRLLRLSDLQELEKFYIDKSEFVNRMHPLANTKQPVRDLINQRLKSHNLPSFDLIFQPKWEMRITKLQEKNLARYRELLSPFGISVNIDSNALPQSTMIKTKVIIAHVKKSFVRNFGMQWPTEFSATQITGQQWQLDTLQASLKTLENEGYGQVLATPTLLSQSHKKSEFHSGGEFPVITTTQFNNAVEWKRYGLTLNVTPKTNSKGALQLSISIEMSSIDNSTGSNGIPGILRNHVRTQINLRQPNPVLLSGFNRQDWGESDQGLPWLRQIPLFKPLFANGQIHNHEMELVFILIPSFYNDEFK